MIKVKHTKISVAMMETVTVYDVCGVIHTHTHTHTHIYSRHITLLLA